MKIAVTGGDGFIGRATIKAAESLGHEAWSFDRSMGNDVLGPLDALEGAEAVIHLAGVLGTHELFDEPERAIDINIKGSLRVMMWCIANNARYVEISMPPVFPSIYTATKISAGSFSRALEHSRGLNYSTVVAYNVFGPGQAFGPGHPQKIIPTFAIAGWRGDPIPVWGDGTQSVDLIYVEDAAKILVRAAIKKTPGKLYAGTGIRHTVLDVAQTIAKWTESKGGVLLLPMRDGEIPTEIVSPVSEAPFRNSDLLETVEWYRQHA